MVCDMSDDDDKQKLRSYGPIILLVICIILEIISAICAFVFGSEYDETDLGFTDAAGGLIIAGIIGQIVCGGCAVCLEKTAVKLESCSKGCGALLAFVVIGLAGIWLGVLQLIATILMAIVTANNSAPNVQAFGGFITALNGIITMLSITYCCFIHGSLLSRCETVEDD